MSKQSRLFLVYPIEPVRCPPLVTTHSLGFPHSPLDQNAVKSPENRVKSRFVETSEIDYPSMDDRIEHLMFGDIKDNMRLRLKKSEVFINGCVWNVYEKGED